MESFAKRLGPAHIDPRVWPRPQHSAAKWHPSCAVVDSPTVGRHVVAQHSINPGTVLVSEYPYLQYLYPPHRPTHCANCFRQNTSWKCRNQSCKWRVSYCSSQCERRYWQIIHQWFCSLPELQDLFDADALLAWQAYWLNQSTIPGLVSNIDRLSPQDRSQYTAKASALVSIFYASSSLIPILTEIQAQIRCNSFGIQHISSSSPSLIVVRTQVVLGKAVYLQGSMFNHGCRPNAIALFSSLTKEEQNGLLLQIQTTGDIVKSGSQLTISYGPLATRSGTQERRKELAERYLFQCQCEACSGPQEELLAVFKCTQCSLGRFKSGARNACPHCGHHMDWQKIEKLEDKIDHLLETGQLSLALEHQREIYHDDALAIGKTLDQLAFGAAQQGQFKDSVNYLRKSLAIVKHHFGPNSLEAAEEMMKLSSILLNAGMFKAAKRQVNDTIKVYQMLSLDARRPDDFQELLAIRKYLTC